MIDPRLDRAALVLGVATLASSVFAVTTGRGDSVDLVHLRGAGLVVILVLGVVAVLGATLHRPLLVMVPGAGLVVAALLQLAQVGRRPNLLGGDGSTLSLMGGLGLGLLVVGLAARQHSRQPVRIENGSQHTT